MMECDIDGSGGLNYDEYSNAVLELMGAKERYDAYIKGMSWPDYSQLMLNITDSKKVHTDMDSNQDGEVTKAEMLSFFCN